MFTNWAIENGGPTLYEQLVFQLRNGTGCAVNRRQAAKAGGVPVDVVFVCWLINPDDNI